MKYQAMRSFLVMGAMGLVSLIAVTSQYARAESSDSSEADSAAEVRESVSSDEAEAPANSSGSAQADSGVEAGMGASAEKVKIKEKINADGEVRREIKIKKATVGASVEVAAPSKLEARIQALESQVTVLRSTAKPAAAATIKGGFEKVPTGQADSLIQRIELVSEIIRKHGRAYDYRTMTIRELKAVKTSLDAKGFIKVSSN